MTPDPLPGRPVTLGDHETRVTDTGGDGEPITVCVPVRDVEVTAQVWRVDVGRVPLFLLDTERPENDNLLRWTTSRLYDGDPDTRLSQYALLGLGGTARSDVSLRMSPARAPRPPE